MSGERYVRAERFLPWNAADLVFRSEVAPIWLEGGDRFQYVRRTRWGEQVVEVDPEAGTMEVLPLPDYRLEPPEKTCATGDLPAPDGRWRAVIQNHNVLLPYTETGQERWITRDGQEDHGYILPRPFTLSDQPLGLWAPDSRKLLLFRVDRRNVGLYHLLQSVPAGSDGRPVLFSYDYVLPGDTCIPTLSLLVYDVAGDTTVPIQLDSLTTLPFPIVWWSSQGDRLYCLQQERGFAAVRLYEAEPQTGAVRLLLEEEGFPRAELHAYQSKPKLVPKGDGTVEVSWIQPHSVRFLDDGAQFLWYSQRDGWGHLYLYDAESGNLLTRLTAGPWMVHDIVHVNEDTGWVYFTAGGREEGRDPYYRHLYRVRLDGTGVELLTPEDADHEISFSPGGKYFVDRHSRVDLPPITVLRTCSGELIMELERADVEPLVRTGWKPPRRFTATAADGTTPIYGVIFYPSDFDPEQRYPVIDDIYPGPHNARVPKSFPTPRLEEAGGQWTGHQQDYWRAQALAELGFIVVILDARGTALRGTEFHYVELSFNSKVNNPSIQQEGDNDVRLTETGSPGS